MKSRLLKMDDFYDHIQYVVPGKSEINFSISPEARHVFLKLLDGVADIYVKDKKFRLRLQQEFSIQLWECLCPRMKTKTRCNFLVRGNHYVSSAIQHGPIEKTLFAVLPSDNSYSFVLEKDIQLQIFPVKPTEEESPVTISSSRGSPEVCGFKLSREMTYHLSPFSPVLLKSSDEKPYSVYVNGLDRKVKLSIRDENHHEWINNVKDRIFTKYLSTNQFKNVLVLGPRYVGKSSFCHLLVNEALEKNISPIYVDLNVKRNVSVPGSLSLSEIESRIDSSLDFKYNIRNLLYYGFMDFDRFGRQLYCFLLRKMGALLKSNVSNNSKERCLSIIDTDGSPDENDMVIDILLRRFPVGLVVCIGDEQYYEKLRNSILGKNTPLEFIPKPRNAEQLIDSYEAGFYRYRIQNYFFGIANPSTRNARTIALSLITIYRFSIVPRGSLKGDNISDYKTERVYFNTSENKIMLKHLFGVSTTAGVDFHALTQVQYYVYFTDIDMTTAKATLMVPASESFNGGNLLMGRMIVFEDHMIT